MLRAARLELDSESAREMPSRGGAVALSTRGEPEGCVRSADIRSRGQAPVSESRAPRRTSRVLRSGRLVGVRRSRGSRGSAQCLGGGVETRRAISRADSNVLPAPRDRSVAEAPCRADRVLGQAVDDPPRRPRSRSRRSPPPLLPRRPHPDGGASIERFTRVSPILGWLAPPGRS